MARLGELSNREIYILHTALNALREASGEQFSFPDGEVFEAEDFDDLALFVLALQTNH